MWSQLTPAMRFFIFVSGAVSLCKGLEYIMSKRVFISFAVEDKNMRDLLVGQARNENTPFEFMDMSVKKPWDNAWKTQCRQRIKSCHGVIVLVSKNTAKADGAHWEIKCAQEEAVPVMAIYANNDDKGCRLPAELTGKRIQNWSWPNIKKFVSNL